MQGGNRKCKGSEVGSSTAGPGRAEWRAPGLGQGEKTASPDGLPDGGGSCFCRPCRPRTFGLYSRGNGKLLEHFRQGSDIIWFTLLKGTLAAVQRTVCRQFVEAK